MAHAVEQLAEEEIEIAQERVHAADVRQRDPEIAAIFARPRVECEDLRIAQSRTDRLAGLQVFVRHRAEGRQSALERQHHVARADEFLADLRLERADDLVLPHTGKAAPRAVVGDAKRRVGCAVDQVDFRSEPPPSLGEVGLLDRVAKVDFGDDRQDWHLEHDRVQPRSFDRDVDLLGPGDSSDGNEPLVEPEQAQQIDEVALEEAPATEVIELALREPQRAQLPDLVLNFADVGRQRHVGIAAFEAILDLRTREMMQHDLHHRELVEIGVEQRLDDHRGDGPARRSKERRRNRQGRGSADLTRSCGDGPSGVRASAHCVAASRVARRLRRRYHAVTYPTLSAPC